LQNRKNTGQICTIIFQKWVAYELGEPADLSGGRRGRQPGGRRAAPAAFAGDGVAPDRGARAVAERAAVRAPPVPRRPDAPPCPPPPGPGGAGPVGPPR